MNYFTGLVLFLSFTLVLANKSCNKGDEGCRDDENLDEEHGKIKYTLKGKYFDQKGLEMDLTLAFIRSLLDLFIAT